MVNEDAIKSLTFQNKLSNQILEKILKMYQSHTESVHKINSSIEKYSLMPYQNSNQYEKNTKLMLNEIKNELNKLQINFSLNVADIMGFIHEQDSLIKRNDNINMGKVRGNISNELAKNTVEISQNYLKELSSATMDIEYLNLMSNKKKLLLAKRKSCIKNLEYSLKSFLDEIKIGFDDEIEVVKFKDLFDNSKKITKNALKQVKETLYILDKNNNFCSNTLKSVTESLNTLQVNLATSLIASKLEVNETTNIFEENCKELLLFFAENLVNTNAK